jgi:hypothetical protein
LFGPQRGAAAMVVFGTGAGLTHAALDKWREWGHERMLQNQAKSNEESNGVESTLKKWPSWLCVTSSFALPNVVH